MRQARPQYGGRLRRLLEKERDNTQHIADLEAKILGLEVRVGAGETGPIARQLAITRTNLVQIQLEEAKMYCRPQHKGFMNAVTKMGNCFIGYLLTTGHPRLYPAC